MTHPIRPAPWHAQPATSIDGMADEELALWISQCFDELTVADMAYLRAANERMHWAMQLQQAHAERAKRTEQAERSLPLC